MQLQLHLPHDSRENSFQKCKSDIQIRVNQSGFAKMFKNMARIFRKISTKGKTSKRMGPISSRLFSFAHENKCCSMNITRHSWRKKYLHNFCQIVEMQYSYSFADTSSPQFATFNCFFFFFRRFRLSTQPVKLYFKKILLRKSTVYIRQQKEKSRTVKFKLVRC